MALTAPWMGANRVLRMAVMPRANRVVKAQLERLRAVSRAHVLGVDPVLSKSRAQKEQRREGVRRNISSRGRRAKRRRRRGRRRESEESTDTEVDQRKLRDVGSLDAEADRERVRNANVHNRGRTSVGVFVVMAEEGINAAMFGGTHRTQIRACAETQAGVAKVPKLGGDRQSRNHAAPRHAAHQVGRDQQNRNHALPLLAVHQVRAIQVRTVVRQKHAAPPAGIAKLKKGVKQMLRSRPAVPHHATRQVQGIRARTKMVVAQMMKQTITMVLAQKQQPRSRGQPNEGMCTKGGLCPICPICSHSLKRPDAKEQLGKLTVSSHQLAQIPWQS